MKYESSINRWVVLFFQSLCTTSFVYHFPNSAFDIHLRQPIIHELDNIANMVMRGNIGRTLRKREVVAWALVVLQSFILFSDSEWNSAGYFQSNENDVDSKSRRFLHGISLDMNERPVEYYERRRMNSIVANSNEPAYEPPKIHPKEAGLVSRVWRSNGSPAIHPDLKSGSCWCSADEWCICSPALAIDLILRSGEDHIWCVRREDTGLLALMGGFTEVGETSEECVHRELKEEMGLELATDSPPSLFGVYNDPRRDKRRHTTSVVFIADLPADAVPKAGDDATNVVRLRLEDVDKHEFFVDHKTIIHDYIKMMETRKRKASPGGEEYAVILDDSEPFKRSVCV